MQKQKKASQDIQEILNTKPNQPIDFNPYYQVCIYIFIIFENI